MLRLMARLFTSKTKRKPRARKATPRTITAPTNGMVAVSVHYANYVLPAHEALQLMDLLAKAEIYESVYHSDSPATKHDERYTHHIYRQEKEAMNMKLLPDAFYGICKLAGRPEKK